MTRAIDHYTTSISVGPADKPQQGFEVRWNKEHRQLQFTLSFDVGKLLKHLADRGYIEIKQLPPEEQLQTMRFNYPIRDEQALRAFSFANASGLASMLMGMASDLAKEAP